MPAEYWSTLQKWTFEEALKNPIYLYSCITLISLCLIWLLVRKLKQELIPVFSDNDGQVKITQNALHELVKNCSEEIPGIFSPSTTIFKKRSGIYLRIRILIKKNSDIKALRSSLQKSIENTLVENLNFNNYSGSDIIIKGFKQEN